MPAPTRSFQHYEVLRRPDGTAWELGRGAMGITYKAFDVNLCCEVALKVVSSALVENPEARERFVREARAAAALRHRNVASVYHLGNDGEHFFYAMEFVNGETLDALVRQGGPLTVENTLRVILQVARALAAAARQNLVHRDIKPANLMVTHEDADEETVVKVIDFGLARAAANTDDSPPLTIGGFVGTPQYASPEQLEERPLDARSDFYSLGITAWFLLTGRVPFTGSLAAICQQQLTQPPPWEQLSVDVPTCVRGLLGHLLAKEASRRPQNAADLRAEIETCLEKVQGTERKRGLHLPALPAAAQREVRPDTVERVPQTGALLNGRYRLLRQIGGNHGVRVFQARDESAGEKLVAVKILPSAITSDSTARDRLIEDVRLVQAAPLPHLVQIQALERSSATDTIFIVEEWLAGFSLRDLLAGRDGVLPVAEALCLLEQAASATDHAARCRLETPELTLTESYVTFPALAASMDDAPRARALLPKRMGDWPDWTLKIHAFRIDHDPLALDTWAGGVTLLPTAGRGGEKRTDAGGLSAAQSVQTLAKLVYELLGGTSAVDLFRTDALPTRYVPLPVLNEESNGLLRRALSGESGFVNGWQLHEALARAIGGEPTRGDAHFPSTQPEVFPVRAATEIAAKEEHLSNGHGLAPESTLTSPAHLERSARTVVPAGGESVAAFFQDEPDLGIHDPEEPLAGTAWDRLTLVTGKRAHPGRWLAAVVGLAAVFVLVFVGVLAWLLQQTPARSPMTPGKKQPHEPVATTARAPSRQAMPAMLAAHPAASALPSAVIVDHETVVTPTGTGTWQMQNTPVPSPTTAARAEAVPPPSPTETSTMERVAIVRLDSVPQGAQISLGNEVLGTTPCRARLPAGDHQLIARYQDWPETRQTIHLNGTEPRAAVEIRLMRPDLVPGLATASPAAADNRARRILAPAAHRPAYPDGSVPLARSTPTPPGLSTATPGEPEVRTAQRVLTPFRIDGPAAAPPQPSPSATRQPFSADDDEN